ncbi:MAG: response regulator, partial [Leptospira sp.]|nr:response regulator [Leptospira sp.]
MLIENEDPEISGEQKILCIDPDQDVLDQLEKSLTLNSFQVITAKSPGEGMEMMVKFSPEVIITEIIFPELEGPQFLRVLRRINHSAAIIVHTRDTNFDIDKQCGSCFEKIKKPVLLHELIAIVRKAFAFTKNLNIVDELELESSQRMKNQLEWLIWKERSKLTSKISLGKAMIHNIKHSISQGMGVGSLVTQIEMLDLGKKKDENCYKVAAGSFDFLIKASSEVRDWIDHLDRIA